MMNPNDYFWNVTPWNTDDSETLAVRCYVSTDKGALDINNHREYELGTDTRGQQQVTMRKQEIRSAYVPGSFPINHVKDNVIESVEILVRGTGWHDLSMSVDKLVNAFTQPEYYVKWHIEDHSEIWRCWPADYVIETKKEFTHSRMARFLVQVPRYPELALSRYDIQSPNASPR